MRIPVLLALLASLACTAKKEEAPAPEFEAPAWTHLSSATGDLPVPGASTEQTASLVLDFDKDGINDFVIGSRKAPPALAGYRNTAAGWDRLVIDSTTLGIEAGGTCCDIDGDGDLDRVMGGEYSSEKVWWWENPCPDFQPYQPWTRREIKSSGEHKHHDQMFGDFDGDGRAELVFWNQLAGKLFMARIPADPLHTEPWPLEAIYSYDPDEKVETLGQTPVWMQSNEQEGLAAADIDGDGIQDIVGGGRWFRHTGDGKFAVEVIDAGQHFTRAAAGQLKNGGRPEVVFAIGDGAGPIKWYEWQEGRWIGRDLLGHPVHNGHSLQVLDLDGDGNLDVFCAEMRLDGGNPASKVYAFLGDGEGHFRTRIIAEGFDNHESRAVDLDGDGDIDILGKPYNCGTPRLDVWINGGKGFAAGEELPFEHMIIDEHGPADPHTKSAGDLDGDGIADLVTASSAGGPLVWYHSPDWTRCQIAPEGRWSCDAEAADLDGDGDNDLVISEYYGKKRLEWYENPAPAGDPLADSWRLHVIGPPRAHDIEAADLDSDGDIDLVSRGQSGFGALEGDRLVLWRHDGPDSWAQQIVECPHGEGIALADLERDGDLDLVTGGRWYENPGRIDGSVWAEHIFAEWNPDAVVKTGDFNADGLPDAALTAAEATDSVSWFENPGPSGAGSWTEHVINERLEKGHSLGLADLDNDGDLDVATAEMHQSEDPDEVIIFVNQGGGLAWRKQVLANTGSHDIRVGDFDGDGDADIYGANWQSVWQDSLAFIEVWRNNSGSAAALSLHEWTRRVLDSGKPWRSIFIAAGDLDGDNLPDVATGGWWYKNPGAEGKSWTRRTFGDPLRNLALLYDFDSDGRQDVLGTSGRGSDPSADFVWARNNGGGTFEILSNIPPADGDFLQGVGVGRSRPEGPLAIALSWHTAGKGIQALILPGDPVAEQWTWTRVCNESQDEQLSVGDIDGDGDLDLLLGTLWLENQSGAVRLDTLFNTTESPDRNRLADIDGDGRLDAVVGYEAINVPGKLAWYENVLPDRGQWIEHLIAAPVGPMSLDVTDLDGDGDLDVVLGEHNYERPETARLLVFRNLDGRGKLWLPVTVYTGDEHHDGAVTVDIDRDGDLDIISIGWSHPNVLLYENGAL